jgi:hypothetical protein
MSLTACLVIALLCWAALAWGFRTVARRMGVAR